MLKKIISVVLSLVVASLLCIQTIAISTDNDELYPIIIVPGYASAGMYYEAEDGSQSHVWNIDMDLITKRLIARSVDLAKGIGKLTKGNAQYIADVVGEEFVNMFEHIKCNPDGTSMYNLKRYCSTAEDSNSAYLDENMDGMYEYEPEIMAMYGSYIGTNYKEYIYNFNCDFRMGPEDIAGVLNDYVDDVLEHSGAEKVNIYCISHGGQIGATFLNLYGVEKADVLNNVIITEPAIGGSGLAYDLFNGNLVFDEYNLFNFVEYGMMYEDDYHWLVANESLDFLDDVLNAFLPHALNVVQYWGSLWSFVPYDVYEETRDNYLDKDASALLIEKADYFHNVIYPNMQTKLQDCVDAGINVYIIAGSGIGDLAGYDGVSSDAIIVLEGSTGATVAPLGERFNDGYKTLNTKCSDPTHNHLSPSMDVDMSTGYLPEYTWIVDGLYHGMTIKNDYTTDLITFMMFSNKRIDIYTSKNFPQFHADTSRSRTVTASFNNSVEGYVSSEDTSLVVTNLSKEYNMKLVSVMADGLNINFDCSLFKDIPVGESVELSFKGNLPQVSKTVGSITVNYILIGSKTPVGSRTLNFTIMNGASAEYDSENPTVSLATSNDFLLNMINSYVSSLAWQKIITFVYNATKALMVNIATSIM